MPTIADWLMVIITAIYVVATIFIWRANKKSANATKAQVEESKRQFEETRRLEVMPYIQFEQTKITPEHEMNLVLDSGDSLTGEYVLYTCMKNVGNGTAKDIQYTYQWDNCTKSYDHGAFPVQALFSGDNQRIKIGFVHTAKKIEERQACICLRYQDLLENMYTQKVCFKFMQQSSGVLKLVEFSTSAPVLLPKE